MQTSKPRFHFAHTQKYFLAKTIKNNELYLNEQTLKIRVYTQGKRQQNTGTFDEEIPESNELFSQKPSNYAMHVR